ncbi:MAG TPA: valine--tRNA ligase [Candidatus Moranbacteria bacterium]|nr:valine--tRNA ligase [Candidatus Moranbacteria bacterium]
MKEIPKTYEAGRYEDKIYELWEKSGFFNPDNLDVDKDASSYTIVMPPPNVTGVLHMGSAMMLAVEDLLIRYNRMQGKRTLWIPGTDHASIATQNRVEKDLKVEGLDRHKLGKEKFLKRVKEFALNSQKTILKQMRKMGSSCDWSRLAYTLDETRSAAVQNVFKLMYDDGLIYRGKRIVNWCPRCHSTLADDEVEYIPKKEKLYWIKYGPFTLATSRPETKLGDTAVAVHPKDKRYKKYVGKNFMIPGVLGEFEVEVVADYAVDMEFGTGVIKVTPAHDFTDNQIAQRHNLPMKQIINEEGRMMKNTGKYAGMTTAEAREAIVNDMEKIGLIDHIDENYDHNIAVCYRCGTQIEPLPSTQWFIDVNKEIPKYKKSIKELSFEAVKKGIFGRNKIKIIPERFEKNYFHWMENLRDWCISRQIWFGHRLPVWYKDEEIYVGVNPPEGEGWKQDEDTLDTWFSSGLWTFSTMAQKPADISIENNKIKIDTEDFKNFHPTNVLETMYDILFFWVARMIIMTTYSVGDIPFQDIYLHGCVRDKFGDKMSKSKPETNIDPLDVCEKYGTDAVRLSLLIGTTPGNDLNIYDEKIKNFRNFVTKLWNIYRYCLATENFTLAESIKDDDIKSLSDKWIVSELNELIAEITDDISKYKFSLAGEKLEKFTWGKFADWYIEIHKIEKNDAILGYVLDKILKLWHPFVPFVTEKIYNDFYGEKRLLMVEEWPKAGKKEKDAKTEKEFKNLKDTIAKIRNLRSSYHINPAQIIDAYTEKTENKEIIEKLARVKIIEGETPKKSIKIASLDLDIAELINIKKEIDNIEKEIKNLENAISKTEILLKNESYIKKADKDVVSLTKSRVLGYKDKLKSQQELLKNLIKL